MEKYRFTFTKGNGARITVKANTLSGAIKRAALTAADDWTYIRELATNDIARPVVIRHD